MPTIHPSREEFRKRSANGNLVPVWREVLADMETPVSAFRKLGDSDYAFLLESVEQGEKIGRYSFLGADPKILFKSKGAEVQIHYLPDDEDFCASDAPLDELRGFMSRYRPVADPALPPFVGGAVGYIAYDTIRTLEKLPDANPDDLRLPDCFFMITDTMVIFDHVRRRMILLANAHVRNDVDEAYDEAVHRIDVLAGRIARPPIPRDEEEPEEAPPPPAERAAFQSNFTREDYETAVRRIVDYIHAGDAFQVVFSQRFQRPVACDAFDVYRALRAINPSPYNFYLKFGDLRLIGSSPEILCRVQGDKVSIRPIAGTRPRGATPDEDLQLEKELLADPKECAEHIMLVDLWRNDVGRVARFGTVAVEDLMVIERYSHVMHIVSSVTGRLRPGLDAYDAIKATFPHGTVSGAPKIRAMEIIDECEKSRRGPYAGCVGYFSFDGNCDTCITIRTLLIKEGMSWVQAGGGIVADSDPATEYQETVNKASALFRAVEFAEQGLDV
ncbi:MAG: anthranilate synthase component I [Candidatus Sumerlaeota bacterium]|nr:anthranilate synthase component I [Candidatus Sumerlaeota bacterium]